MPTSDGLDGSDERTVEILLVTAPRCHFCSDALALLDDLASEYNLAIDTIALESDDGVAIATRFRVPFPPVLLINGTYFGHGRISRRKLTKALDAIVRTEVSR